MQYLKTLKAKFIERPNRFISRVSLDGKEEIVHVKNTGRCKELLIPGAEVILEKAANPQRKTAFSLVGVYKGKRLINIDSQAPNQVVFEALRDHKLPQLGEIRQLKREVGFGNSRFDIYFETAESKCYLEVKGVTLENDGLAMFPDAPTLRGTKHVAEMQLAVTEGYRGFIFFLIQMEKVKGFTPNQAMDPDFAAALRLAAANGVEILAYESLVGEESLSLGKIVPVLL